MKTPDSVRLEHEELHAWLVKLKSAGGKTGEAAKLLGNILHPHAVHENEYVMPVLGLLPEIAKGNVTQEMRSAILMAEHVKRDFPRMVEEHKMIAAAADALAVAAKAERKTEAVHLAEHLKRHFRAEEELQYPAVIVIGEYLKMKLQ